MAFNNWKGGCEVPKFITLYDTLCTGNTRVMTGTLALRLEKNKGNNPERTHPSMSLSFKHLEEEVHVL